jgi:hypothetical protein
MPLATEFAKELQMLIAPSFSICAPLEDSDNIITVYGIKTSAHAKALARAIFRSGLVKKVEVTKQWKLTKRSPWQRQIIFTL